MRRVLFRIFAGVIQQKVADMILVAATCTWYVRQVLASLLSVLCTMTRTIVSTATIKRTPPLWFRVSTHVSSRANSSRVHVCPFRPFSRITACRVATVLMLQLIGGTSSAGITALALTPNRRLLAVAEAALTERGCATVNIYDAATLKRRKMLSWPEMGSSSIVAVAFSGDGRLCLTQGGAPEWKLVLWTAEKVSCS